MELPPELKERYLVRRNKDLIDCNTALIEKTPTILERIGHQLKGNAATYGYPELGLIGAAMETSAKNNNWDELALLTGKFEQFLLALPKHPAK